MTNCEKIAAWIKKAPPNHVLTLCFRVGSCNIYMDDGDPADAMKLSRNGCSLYYERRDQEADVFLSESDIANVRPVPCGLIVQLRIR